MTLHSWLGAPASPWVSTPCAATPTIEVTLLLHVIRRQLVKHGIRINSSIVHLRHNTRCSIRYSVISGHTTTTIANSCCRCKECRHVNLCREQHLTPTTTCSIATVMVQKYGHSILFNKFITTIRLKAPM